MHSLYQFRVSHAVWSVQCTQHIPTADGVGACRSTMGNLFGLLGYVVIFGRTWEEHLQRLRAVLSRLQEAQLKLTPQKCQFFRKSVMFLGHIISSGGVSTDPAKISAIVQ